MPPPPPFVGTPKEHLRALRILSGALAAGATIFALVVIGLNQIQGVSTDKAVGYKSIFLVISIAVAVICFLSASIVYKKGIATVKGKPISLDEKLNVYRSTLIKYLALCEGPALLAIISFFATGYYYLLIVAAIMIIAMMAKWPLKSRLFSDIELDWKEQQEFE